MRKVVVIIICSALIISAVLLNENPAGVITAAQVQQLSVEAANAADTAPAPAEPEVKKEKLHISFSETNHFYTDDIDTEIMSNIPEAEIYYTIDGSEPTSESKIYTEPIHFDAFNTTRCVTLKAAAMYDGSVTSTLVHTYFIGSDVNERFSTLVFSLSTDDAHLYDYDTGIFVEGRLRDDYIKQNPGEKIDPPAPANFNIRGRDGERPVYVEVFTQNGDRVLAQAAGLRVQGGWSRASDQKSLRLIARKSYEPEEGKFHYNFFPGETVMDGYGTPLMKFDELVLRNGANDREFGMLRSETASRLARSAGFREVTPVRAASVFVNGEYYGFSWLTAGINEQYLQDVYGSPTRDFEIIGDGDVWYNTDNYTARESLIEMNGYAKKDLTNDEIFSKLEKIVDIDNFLFYYAYEIYMDNNDWPNNNMKRWRYTGSKPEGAPKELDGRWRYIMYDLDWTLGLYGGKYTSRTFNDVIGSGSGRNAPLLDALLKRRDIRAKFAALVCDIAENIVTKDNVEKYIAELYQEARQEIDRAFSAHKYAFWVNQRGVLSNHGEMVEFAANRSQTAYKYLKDTYGYDKMFDVTVKGGEALLNSQTASSGKYFAGLDVPVSPVLPKFTDFDHWLVNGKKVEERDILLTAQHGAIGGGNVELELVTRESLPPLYFLSAQSNAESNSCVLVNETDKTISTQGLYLSDSPDNPLLYAVPQVSVKPGASLEFAGKGSNDPRALFKVQLSFRIKNGEVLLLSDEEGNIVDYIAVP